MNNINPFSLDFLLLLLFTSTTQAAYSVLSESYLPGPSFFNKFDFFTGPDPTQGHVSYQPYTAALKSGLISSCNDSVYLGVDSLAVAPAGRKSVRLESKKHYERGLFILDAQHMPQGCGTWPAFWTVGATTDVWPAGGEIDIVEGVNDMAENNMALHTTTNCSVTGLGATGKVVTRNCDVAAKGQAKNVGCATHDMRPESFGEKFNKNGGGVYAMEWTSLHIKVWFFARNTVIPADVFGPNPAPESWGTPASYFTGIGGNSTTNTCNIDTKFKPQKIIINTTFCGDWGGAAWGICGCQTRNNTCNDFVANNPKAFKNAYWRIKSLKVFSS